MRVNLNIPDELVKRLDEYAKANYTSRSSVMCQACDQYLAAKAVTGLMQQLVDVMHKIADNNNECDEDSLKQIQEIEAMLKMLKIQD